ITGRVRLRDDAAGEPLTPIIVVALRAGEVELALTPVEQRATRFDERAAALVGAGRDRHAARLFGHIGRERQQLARLPTEGQSVLMLGAATVDALLEIDRPPVRIIERRVARRDALHTGPRVPVTAGA